MTTIDGNEIAALVDAEIERIADERLVQRIQAVRVAPYPVEREWDYGKPGEHYTCWTVLEHPESNTGVAYCEEGFGPSNPWGLVFLSGQYVSIGMDSQWFSTLESAVRDSLIWDQPNPEGYEVP